MTSRLFMGVYIYTLPRSQLRSAFFVRWVAQWLQQRKAFEPWVMSTVIGIKSITAVWYMVCSQQASASMSFKHLLTMICTCTHNCTYVREAAQ